MRQKEHLRRGTSNPFAKYSFQFAHNLSLGVINYCAMQLRDYQMFELAPANNVRLYFGAAKGAEALCGTFIQVILNFCIFIIVLLIL